MGDARLNNLMNDTYHLLWAVRYKKGLLAFFPMAGSMTSNGWKGGLQ